MIIFDKPVDGINLSVLQRFAPRAQKLAGVKGEVAILITSRHKVQALNRRFRRKDKPTDVLSFAGPRGGDIAICVEIARQNAHRLGHSIIDEIKILMLHGMLHLAGYDHETDSGEMERAEARLRTKLKLPVSLIQRTRPTEIVKLSALPRKTRRRQTLRREKP